MPHSNCLCPPPTPFPMRHWLLEATFTLRVSEEKEGVGERRTALITRSFPQSKCLFLFSNLPGPPDWWAAPNVITLNKPPGNGLFNITSMEKNEREKWGKTESNNLWPALCEMCVCAAMCVTVQGRGVSGEMFVNFSFPAWEGIETKAHREAQ